MRVLIDANVWLSYLVGNRSDSTIPRVVRTCLSSDIELLVPAELIEEIKEALATKPYFKHRVSADAAQRLIALLQSTGRTPSPPDSIDQFVADPEDDYLIAYGLMYEVDFLITGDSTVRALNGVEHMRIVTPAEFLRLPLDE